MLFLFLWLISPNWYGLVDQGYHAGLPGAKIFLPFPSLTSLSQIDDEFEHLEDEEEFENFDKEKDSPKGKTPDKLPDLQIAKVSFYLTK